MIDEVWAEVGEKAWEFIKQADYDPMMIEDDDEVRRFIWKPGWVNVDMTFMIWSAT
jgi:hypothetical protein